MEASHNVGDDIKWVNFINWSLCIVNQFVEKLGSEYIIIDEVKY